MQIWVDADACPQVKGCCDRCGIRSSEQAQEQMDAVDSATSQTSHHRAVDPDVLQIVAGVLLDEADGASGAEGEHTLLDDLGDPPVVTLDRVDEAALDPEVEVAAQDLVGDHVQSRLLQALGHPPDHLRTWTLDVGEHRALELRGEII